MNKTHFVSQTAIIILLIVCICSAIATNGSSDETDNQEDDDDPDGIEQESHRQNDALFTDVTFAEFMSLLLFFIPSILIVLMAWCCHWNYTRYKTKLRQQEEIDVSLTGITTVLQTDPIRVYQISSTVATLSCQPQPNNTRDANQGLDYHVVHDVETLPSYESIVKEFPPPNYIDAINMKISLNPQTDGHSNQDLNGHLMEKKRKI